MITQQDCEALANSGDCYVVWIGSNENQMRLVCECRDESLQGFVIVMLDVWRFFDKGVVNYGPITLEVRNKPGTFGFPWPDEKRDYRELLINSKADWCENLFRAIARSITFRAVECGDRGYPV